MLIDKYGNIDNKIKGVVTKDNNIILSENQFLQWTSTGKRLELWEGKKEFLERDDYSSNINRIKYWNESSIYGFII
jgi:hypothetical protein